MIYASFSLGKEKGKEFRDLVLWLGPHFGPTQRPGGDATVAGWRDRPDGLLAGACSLLMALLGRGLALGSAQSARKRGAGAVHSRSRSTAGAGGPSVCLGGLGPPSLFLPSVRGAPSAVRAPSPPADGSRPGCLAPRWRPAMAARGCALPSAIPCPSPC